MESKEYAAKIETPAEIVVPMTGIADHGLKLVHEMGGKPRNYLHEVSIERHEQDAIRFLDAAGYAQNSGWIGKDGRKYWLYTKSFPLSVAAWAVRS